MPSETVDKLTADVVLNGAHPMGGPSFVTQLASVDAEAQLRRDNTILRRELAMMRLRAAAQEKLLARWESERSEAAALQRDLLPHTLPTSDSAHFDVLFVPTDSVSGDLYHVVRLDDEHLAVWVIDATGHGMAAGTLVACVQRSLCRMAGGDTNVSAMDPSAVLTQLNREILAIDLTDCQFVAATYAVYHERTGLLRWSRGGGCHPVMMRSDGQSKSLMAQGPLVGMTDRADFGVGEVQLVPGETVLFYSDGLETAVAPGAGHTAGEHSVATWLEGHSAISQTSTIKRINKQVRLSRSDERADDVAVVALHVPATTTRADQMASSTKSQLLAV